jgi:hypothetical protein
MSKTTIYIDVVNLVATNRQRDTAIVCANKSYEVKFNFDSAWDEYPNKTARFIWNGEHRDVDFTGDTCGVPEIRGASYVNVGVYVADAIQTTTSAEILCHPSILCLKTKASLDDDIHYQEDARESAIVAKMAADRAVQAEAAADLHEKQASLAADRANVSATSASASAQIASASANTAIEIKQDIESMLGNVGDVEAALDRIIELQNSYIDQNMVGVATALDEIIEIQNNLIGGGES